LATTTNTEHIPLFSLRKVLKGASIYSLGDVFAKTSGFFLIPLYTRVLTPDDFGIVGYLQVLLRIATIILSFGFQVAQTRYYYENHTDSVSLGRFLFTINMVPVSLAILIGIPLTILGIVNHWVIGSENIPFYPYMVLIIWIAFCRCLLTM